MNKQIAKELHEFSKVIAERFSRKDREGNVSKESFKVDEVIPTSDHTAVINFKKSSGKIGVVQGKTYESIASCYDYMDKIAPVDMIAISFDYSYYQAICPHPNKYVSWMLGRVKLLGDLVSDGVINKDKPHHLLGCGLPQEFSFYKHSDYDWLYSLDTSNPVVHGIKGISYRSEGLWSKESQKLFELTLEKNTLIQGIFLLR